METTPAATDENDPGNFNNNNAPGVRTRAETNPSTNYKEAHHSMPLKSNKKSSSPGKKARNSQS